MCRTPALLSSLQLQPNSQHPLLSSCEDKRRGKSDDKNNDVLNTSLDVLRTGNRLSFSTWVYVKMKWTLENSSWGNEGCPESSRKSGQATGYLLKRACHCTDRKIEVLKGVFRKWSSLEFRTVQLQS